MRDFGPIQGFSSLAVGLIMPYVISWVKARHWADGSKVLLSLVICVLGGLLVSVAAGLLQGMGWHITGEQWVANAGIVFSAATTFYKTWFQGTAVEKSLTAASPFAPDVPSVRRDPPRSRR